VCLWIRTFFDLNVRLIFFFQDEDDDSNGANSNHSQVRNVENVSLRREREE
jgi:hypothetical protein